MFDIFTQRGKSRREINRLRKRFLNPINELDKKFTHLTDKEIQEIIMDNRVLLHKGLITDEIVIEVFAAIREAAWRVLGKKPFDEQVLGGLIVYEGKISELKTGEGKTLMSAFPAILRGLMGTGVHVHTVNDYLAKRDHEILLPVYRFCGLTSGYVTSETPAYEKQEIYRRDIIHGTASRLVFDFLESNMSKRYGQKFKWAKFAIVDEADNILLDDARIPLIISSSSNKSSQAYSMLNPVFASLREHEHYTINIRDKTAYFTKSGYDIVETFAEQCGLITGNLFSDDNVNFFHVLLNLLKAHGVMTKDKDYVVMNDEIVIIEPSTGRLGIGKKFSWGLHQAIEGKEGLKVSSESIVKASITYPNFFKTYSKFGGMTGTGITEVHEFQSLYDVDVIEVPVHNPKQRIDEELVELYKTKMDMYNAVATDIKRKYEIGQPVLIGTESVMASQELSSLLGQMRVPHNVLNAKNHKDEAYIIAQAGRLGAVTISTNMAGRGVDIQLGGNAEMHSDNLSETEMEDSSQVLNIMKRRVAKEKAQVMGLGGLHVIICGTLNTKKDELQLRGRSGRQGDPGSTKAYCSLEDAVILESTDGVESLTKLNWYDDLHTKYIQNSMVNEFIDEIQRGKQNQNYEAVKHILNLDNIIHKQRTSMYSLRDYLMLTTEIKNVAIGIMDQYVNRCKSVESLLEVCEKFSITTESKNKEGIKKEIINAFYNNIINLSDSEIRGLLLKHLDSKYEIQINQNEDLKRTVFLAQIAQQDMYSSYDTQCYMLFVQMTKEYEDMVINEIFSINRKSASEDLFKFENLFNDDMFKGGFFGRAHRRDDSELTKMSDLFDRLSDSGDEGDEGDDDDNEGDDEENDFKKLNKGEMPESISSLFDNLKTLIEKNKDKLNVKFEPKSENLESNDVTEESMKSNQSSEQHSGFDKMFEEIARANSNRFTVSDDDDTGGAAIHEVELDMDGFFDPEMQNKSTKTQNKSKTKSVKNIKSKSIKQEQVVIANNKVLSENIVDSDDITKNKPSKQSKIKDMKKQSTLSEILNPEESSSSKKFKVSKKGKVKQSTLSDISSSEELLKKSEDDKKLKNPDNFNVSKIKAKVSKSVKSTSSEKDASKITKIKKSPAKEESI
jgi:preprotein translocase subunit SecA